MRLVAGIALIGHAISIAHAQPRAESIILSVFASAAGLLLTAGMWTPISGVGVAMFELWSAFSQPGDPWARILLGTLGLALAMLGPGVWSVDARLFGWKQIDIQARLPRKS